jgi:hypothetical protein
MPQSVGRWPLGVRYTKYYTKIVITQLNDMRSSVMSFHLKSFPASGCQKAADRFNAATGSPIAAPPRDTRNALQGYCVSLKRVALGE